MKVQTIFSILGALLLSAAVCVPLAAAQSVDAVINEMKARYQQQLEAVDSYIIETENYTSYHRKVSRNGEPTYETQTRWNDQAGMFDGLGATESPLPSLSQLDTLALHATYGGTESVDGHRTHVLLVDDPSALGGYSDVPEDDVVNGEMKLYVDADRYVPLLMEFTVQVEQDGQMQTMHPRMRMSDYRTVDGLTLPWKMEMTMEDLDASISEEERAEARRGLEELEARMAEMPEEQRRMMEGMMENQIEQLRQIVEEGSIHFAIEVQDVQVNVPMPDGVFDE